MGIKSDGFELGSMHFGATGAQNDTDTAANGQKMKELLESGPVTEDNTVSNGGEGPRSA